jgi:hypothetical protein
MLSFVLATFLLCSLSIALLGWPALIFLPTRPGGVDRPDHLVNRPLAGHEAVDPI